MKNKSLKICLVDDNTEFREAFKLFIRTQTQWKILFEADSGDMFKKKVDENEMPDIAFIDYHLPKVNGITVAKHYNFIFPQVKLIAISMFTNKLFLDELLAAGFKGAIQKQDVFQQLIPAITKVMNDEIFFIEDFQVNNAY